MEPTERWLRFRFRGDTREANLRSLRAGNAFGETSELFPISFHVPEAKIEPRALIAILRATPPSPGDRRDRRTF